MVTKHKQNCMKLLKILKTYRQLSGGVFVLYKQEILWDIRYLNNSKTVISCNFTKIALSCGYIPDNFPTVFKMGVSQNTQSGFSVWNKRWMQVDCYEVAQLQYYSITDQCPENQAIDSVQISWLVSIMMHVLALIRLISFIIIASSDADINSHLLRYPENSFCII